MSWTRCRVCLIDRDEEECYNCKGKGHFANNCKEPGSLNCYRCKKPGHWARSYPALSTEEIGSSPSVGIAAYTDRQSANSAD